MSFKILINGAAGRMGQAVQVCARDAGIEVSASIDAGDDISSVIDPVDAVIDFSAHTATAKVIEAAVAAGKALVIGTTGHAADERTRLRELAAKTRTVWAGNFSIGVNLLFYLTEQATKALPLDYNAEIVEMHHRFKKDAPSGTAARLAEVVMDARKLAPDKLVHGREGIVGARPTDEVGMHSLRGGDVVGDHTVIFAALGERLELTHKASDRAIFARGALRAAEWVLERDPGLYDMQDVLGLRD